MVINMKNPLPLFGVLLLGTAFASGILAADGFDGVDRASIPVMEQARRRIESIRKGDFRVSILDPAGKPFTGRASVRLTRHEFRFGASAYGIPRLPEPA